MPSVQLYVPLVAKLNFGFFKSYFYVHGPLFACFCSFPTMETTQAPVISLLLPLTQSLLYCRVGRAGGGGSVETPISRTSRPPEGHSQSFGVRTDEGWVGQEPELSAGPRSSHTIIHTFLTATAVCIFLCFCIAKCWQKRKKRD